MTAVIPTIHVENKKTQIINNPGNAGKVAVIGAFDTTETEPKLFMTVGEAQTTFGTDDTYQGCAVVEDLFYGAESLLCVNITTETTVDTVTTREKEITTAKLTAALAKIKGEDFDILFVAGTLTDTLLPIITAFLDEVYAMKMPAGFVGCLNGANTAADVTSAGLAGDHCYGLITQRFRYPNYISLIRSAAFYCGVIASMKVGNTMTMKQVPKVQRVTPELSFETGGDGKSLLEAGITTFKVLDRAAKKVVVVNAEQPNGYDLYINRVRDYVVKQMALQQFLGDRNVNATLSEIKQELDRVADNCINTLDLLEDIKYTVVREDATTVGITIDSLVFSGIITKINVYVRVEVE